MKPVSRTVLGALVCLSLGGLAFPVVGQAETSIQTGGGHIEFTGETGDGLVKDPENPGTTVDPGDSPKTTGPLRIEFVPTLNFHANRITKKDAVYPVNAQLFHDGTSARGNFIQISDYRGEAKGWTLQLRQETQFQNTSTANRQLDGAVLSFDKSWVNSTQPDNLAPTVSKEVIRLDNIGDTYNLAEATEGTGSGTWAISFGASAENPKGVTNTLTPKVDTTGEAVLDENFGNQQIYENSAITLSIPGATKIDPVTYSTVLTWILAELP